MTGESVAKNEPCEDPVVEAVVASLRARSAAGLAKYGTTLARGDLTRLQWMQHAQEELLDGANYLERLKSEEDELASAVKDLYQAWAALPIASRNTMSGGVDRLRKLTNLNFDMNPPHHD